jgi:hypothetical protein
VLDMPLVLENSEHCPHRRITRRLRQRSLNLGGRRAAPGVQNIDDLPPRGG